MENEAIKFFFYAGLGGILPTFLWLYFWLREDSKNPEPKLLIVISFVAGMIAVPVSLFVQINLSEYLPKISSISLETTNLLDGSANIIGLLILAGVEEFAKFLAAYFSGFRTKFFDEPIDSMIYLITAALGFAALENTLFIFKFINDGLPQSAIFLGGELRFIGATLLHVVTSGILGAIIAINFLSDKFKKSMAIIIGLVTATILHALFNYSIIVFGDKPFKTFLILWGMVIFLIFLFEIVKKVHYIRKNV